MSTAHSIEPDGDDVHLSIDLGREIELKVKGSRFLATAFAVEREEAARERLNELRRRYHDATHHCSAWRIGSPDEFSERFDDDGEPAGTAGRPILTAIQRQKLFDACIVVTRYFGGTKLGSGGLVRAYGEAADLALESAPRRRSYRCVELRVSCGYESSGTVETLLAKRARILRQLKREFADGPTFRLSVLASHADALQEELIELTAGRVEIHRD